MDKDMHVQAIEVHTSSRELSDIHVQAQEAHTSSQGVISMDKYTQAQAQEAHTIFQRVINMDKDISTGPKGPH